MLSRRRKREAGKQDAGISTKQVREFIDAPWVGTRTGYGEQGPKTEIAHADRISR